MSSESAEQMKLVERCRVTDWKRRESGLPEYGCGRIFHIPNGGWRSKSEAAKFKAMGVVAGVADLFLPVMRVVQAGEGVGVGGCEWEGAQLHDASGRLVCRVIGGLWIEMKASGDSKGSGKGRTSTAQEKFAVEAIRAGYGYRVAWSAEDGWRAVCDYLGIWNGDGDGGADR